MNTTTDQIRALLTESTQRAESATKGPWKLHERHHWIVSEDAAELANLICDAPSSGGIPRGEAAVYPAWDRNWPLIAAARTDLPARDRALMIAVEALTEMALPWQNGWRGASEPNAISANEALGAMLTALQGETACMHCGRPAGEHCGNFPGTPEGACKSDAGDVEHPWRDTKFTAMQGEGGAR